MKRLIITLQLLLAALLVAVAQETLSRGVVVLPAQEGGNFVSWRMLATDDANTVFDVVRDAQIVASGVKLTNYTDKGGKKDSF